MGKISSSARFEELAKILDYPFSGCCLHHLNRYLVVTRGCAFCSQSINNECLPTERPFGTCMQILRTEKRDAYAQFFNKFAKSAIFRFGLDNLIIGRLSETREQWAKLKQRITTSEADLFVRRYGQAGQKSEIIRKLYQEAFGIKINIDGSNNGKPTAMIQKITGYRKSKSIFNYQVSHVFGRTKNVFCYVAPWNIAFVPKILDPLTGHEASGPFVTEFTRKFRSKVFKAFATEITDYNKIVTPYRKEVNAWLRTQKRLDDDTCHLLSQEFAKIETGKA